MKRWPWLLLAAAVALRALACLHTPLPSRDGVHYLWMAEQWAAGHAEALFANVFHPLYPFLVGLCLRVAPGLDPMAAGQLVAAGCGAAAVVPLAHVTRHLFGEGAAFAAAALYTIGNWFLRHPAECMSEGPFYLAAAVWAVALLGPVARPARSGLTAGLAYLVRPEGAALAVAGCLLLARGPAPRHAFRHAGAFAAVALCLPLGSWATGNGFVLTPKAAFNWQVGVGGADSGLAHYALHAVRLPFDAWEGLGYAVFPLALLGIWWQRPRALGGPTLALLLPLLLQCLAIPLVKSNHRFVSGLGILALPFAGAAAAAVFRRLHRRVAWQTLFVLVLAGSEAKLWLRDPADRSLEADLGRWLGSQLRAEETLAADMPRLLYFAGRRPPPPRDITAADLLAWAAVPGCRYVAQRRGRNEGVEAGLRDLGFLPAELPTGLREHPGAEAVVLWQRPRR